MTAKGSQVQVRLGAVEITGSGDTLVAFGLGSCVALILDDREAEVGGMAHVLLPTKALCKDHSNPARSADTAVPHLIKLLCDRGASQERLTARLVGGASMFADLLAAGTVHIGERNVVACRSALEQMSVSIVGESVGGQASRSVWFDTGSGIVTVRTIGHGTVEI